MQNNKPNQITVSNPLPSCLPEDGPKALSSESRKRISQLSRPVPIRYAWGILKTWLTIAIAICAAVHFQNLFVSLLVILIVAGRQLALGFLMHEQAHYLGIKSRWGDLIANCFVAYPLLVVSVEDYARVHLTHHKFYFSDRDPDLLRKSGRHWTFPMKLSRLLFLFLTDFFALNLIKTVVGKNKKIGTLNVKRLSPSYPWLKFVYLAVSATFFTFTHSWNIFLLYWLLPLLTVLQVFIRVGAICEHVYIPTAPLETSTAIIIPSWWESLIFPHLNFFYHIYHHYFPGVPFSHLPEVHRIFVKEGLVKDEHVFKSIIEYFNLLTSPDRSKPVILPHKISDLA